MKTSSQRGFTIVEIVVAVLIILILAALLVPQARNWIERARGSQCLQRLWDLGSLLHGYAADNNSTLRFFRDGAPTQRMWYTELRDFSQMSAVAAQKAFACPSLPAKDAGPWFCYGMRLEGAPGKIERVPGEGFASYSLHIPSVDRPSGFLLMADTFAPANGRQSFRMIPPGLYLGSGIHLRHQGKANILFLDGHVEAANTERLRQIGITMVLNENRQAISTSSSTP